MNDSRGANEPENSQAMSGCLGFLTLIFFFVGTVVKAYVIYPTINDTTLGSLMSQYTPDWSSAEFIACIPIYGICTTFSAATSYWKFNWIASAFLATASIGLPILVMVLFAFASTIVERSVKDEKHP